MDWASFQKRFKISARRKNLPEEFINYCLEYSKKLYDQSLPIIFDVEHFSKLIGYQTKYLYSITNGKTKCYYIYTIKKHNGHNRIIAEPYSDLKRIQTWILYQILEGVQISKFAKGYRTGFSLKDNVKFHINQPVVIKLDVKDFFPSIKMKYVINLFLKLGYSKALSGLLGRLCCYKGCLPQGSPASPYLSNIYCKQLDDRIGSYITQCGFRYTRYSDDITISGHINDWQIGSIIKLCKTRLAEVGLTLNEEKTRILRHHNRQVVTGVVLNDKLSVGTKTKKEIRQQIYYIKKYGLESHLQHEEITKKNYLYHLAGKINWVLFIEKNNKEFLEYKEFVTNILAGNYH